MELRTVDPRSLKFNPNNPRKTAPPLVSDEQLSTNIRQVGLLQPPLTREIPDGLMIVIGERRVRCSITADLSEIPVLVFDQDESDDRIRALSENVQRANMNPVDQWRAIEAAISDRWTEDAIAVAMGLSVRTIRKLRLLANIHGVMLDHMARGDMPDERVLRIIAAATPEEQASVWRKHKPKKNQPQVAWHDVARGLEKRRISAAIAKFGADETEAFGIVWQEDLFEQGDKDGRFTTQVDAFFAAQQAWLEANLPKKGVLLLTDEYGRPKLPPKAQQSWSSPRATDSIGCYVNPRSGAIEEVRFTVPAVEKAKKGAKTTTNSPVLRPEITQKGIAKIGDLRTEALHKAVEETELSDDTLIGLLVMALAGDNVTVESPHGRFGNGRATIAGRLLEGQALTRDSALIRQAARAILAQVLSCRDGMTNSGVIALIAGDAVGADAFLPNMATEEFLSCLSKAGIERTAGGVNVLPRQRGKDTRAALIAHVGVGTFILPAARFAPSTEQVAKLAKAASTPPEDGDEVDRECLDDSDLAEGTDEELPPPARNDEGAVVHAST